MALPTAIEINPSQDLDGNSAEKHFQGKTLEEAEQLFCQNSLLYQEDLMFMGPVAFRFYVQALISYIQSDAATGDADIINSFTGILDHRTKFEPEELVPIASQLFSICQYIVDHYDRFDLDPHVYADLRPRFQSFAQNFLSR